MDPCADGNNRQPKHSKLRARKNVFCVDISQSNGFAMRNILPFHLFVSVFFHTRAEPASKTIFTRRLQTTATPFYCYVYTFS